MVFVKFFTSHQRFTHYFVGASLDDVLADTHGGTEFGNHTFKGYRIISEKTARNLKLGYLEKGIAAIKNGATKSFMLSPPS